MLMKALGELEQLLLFSIIRLQERAYGASIHEEIQDRTGRSVAMGAVYTGLTRLIRNGYVAAKVGEATPERGGRRKKYYSILPLGAQLLLRSVEVHRRMVEGLDGELDELAATFESS